jgi:dienelactone hydrolase
MERTTLVAMSLLFSICAPGPVTAATDPLQPGPFTSGLVTRSVPVTGGATLATLVYYPDQGGEVDPAAGLCPVVVFAHGFTRSPSRYTDFGELLASRGYIVLLPDFPCGPLGCDHDRNSEDLVAVIDWILARDTDPASIFEGHVDTDAIGTSGHSAGGLWSLVAAARDPRIRAAAPMDPVDNGGLGVDSLPSARAAIAVTHSEPGSCNANGSAEDLYAAATGPKRGVKLVGATHCDPEKDSDFFGCALICGSWNAERHERYLRYVNGWIEYHLRCDEDYDPWVWGDEVRQDLDDALIVYERSLAPAPPTGLVAEAAPGGILLRRDPPTACVGVDGWRVYRDDGAGLVLVADALPREQVEWLDTSVTPGTLYHYVARDYFGDFLGEEEGADSDTASASLTSVPLEASREGEVPLTARRLAGGSVEVTYGPAPCASDHTLYWGITDGPLAGAPDWSGQSCLLGDSGLATFNPGAAGPGLLVYFVVVGNDGFFEGSYGRASNGSERPGAEGLPECGYALVPDGECER